MSNGGGVAPVWAPSGKELFYRNGDNIMVVPVQTEPTFEVQTPQVLFQWPATFYLPMNYDISPDDGQRFAMVKWRREELTELHVVLNWFEELKRLVPTGE